MTLTITLLIVTLTLILNSDTDSPYPTALDAENVVIMKSIKETGGPLEIKKWKAERKKNKSKL